MAKPKQQTDSEVRTEGMNPEVLHRRHKALVEENDKLRARLDTQTAIRRIGSDDSFDLLVEIAETLRLAHLHAHPLQAAAFDPNPVTKSKSQPEPGVSTAAARRAEQDFHQNLYRALRTYDAARRRNFTRRDVDRPGKVRCRRDDCPSRDVEVDAWKEIKTGPRRGQKLYAERCISCGSPLAEVTRSSPPNIS